MAPHTCECRICGFQWKRSDEEFSGVIDTRATGTVELNKLDRTGRNPKDAKTHTAVPTKISVSKKACDVPLRKVTLEDRNEEAIGEEQKLTHNAGGKNKSESTVTNTTNKKWVKTGTIIAESNNTSVIAKSKGSLAKSKVAEGVENPVKIVEANLNNNLTKNTDGEGSKRSAVKEVTAMLDDTLVIPERKTIPEQEIIVNFAVDDMEKSTTTYPTIEQGFYSYDENTQRKTYAEKENINMKQKRKIEGHSRVTSRQYQTGRNPLPHNMAGNNYILLFDNIEFNLAQNCHQPLSFNCERSVTISRNLLTVTKHVGILQKIYQEMVGTVLSAACCSIH